MRLLVTGAGGMLGQDLVHAARAAGHDPVAASRAQLDVTDPAAVAAAVAHASPDAIVNCAAWTDVDRAESERAAASAVNGAGAGHVAVAAADAGAPLVHVSTDYVFDGRAREASRESAPTGPLSAYGATKLEGEHAVERAGGEHTIARSSWLFGAGGPNFVETMLRLGAERDAVSVVTDQVGCPTFTGHLAQALVAIAEAGPRGLVHVAGGGACSWHDFAVEIFAQTGVDCRVDPATTAEVARPAPRPAFSVLASERADAPRLPDWREGLAAYLAARTPARASA
ncbi:MAG: dTDP-4-dehydrorhamnose reductase [Solirubrobacteraceae bacterium]|nr:dTDP-4-dehydrorhamnose reductase [Solirubrobacteraceae bacterium]